MITSRPYYYFILLVVIGLLVPCLLIPFWVIKIKEVEKQVDIITNKSHQEIWSIIQNATTTLLPMSSSATNLAKVVNASLGETDFTFNQIQAKVALIQFQALLTIPRVSQISYIRNDGMFFALNSQPNEQIVAIYSNTSFSQAAKDRTNYSWYTQRVNYDSGKLYGEVEIFPPQLLVNETWLQQASNATNGFASLRNSWVDENNQLALNTASVTKNDVISLGFELKSLINVFSSNKMFGGGLYLATKDGRLYSDGIPNTNIAFDGNATIYFQILKGNGNQNSNDHNITIRLNYESPQKSLVDISGTKYVLYSSSLDIIGIQSVYVLALPYDGLQSKMHNDIIFVFVLLLVLFICFAIFIFYLLVLTVTSARKEMCLKAALIKQKEATQQAERKSEKRSLSFVSASHDIRASLAGINGLLDMSMNEAKKGSELAKNLKIMQSCSQDLHRILNSVLDTSKVEAGKMQLEEKPFDLVKVLEGVVDLFYPVGLKKGVDVILDIHDNLLNKFSQVKGDEGRLKQILSNLLSNAIKFTSQGHVSVRAFSRRPTLHSSTSGSTNDQSTKIFKNCFQVCGNVETVDEKIVCDRSNSMEFVFEVNDTGKGIPKEKQASIFENYVQVEETEHELEGTGLGLGIVQSLVRKMGGEISIVDKHIGEKGTCFRFNVIFKVSQFDLRNISEDEKTPSHGNLSSGTNTPFCSPKRQDNKSSIVVLFISSDERRKMAQKFLQAHKIKVLAAKNIIQLTETLKDFKQEQEVICSSKSDLDLSFGYMTWPTSQKEVPLSTLDGSDESDVTPTRRTNRVNSSKFVLLVIDTTRANFRVVSKIVAEFRKDTKNSCYRVVWFGSRCMQLNGLDEKQLPPSDIVIPMPLHGSRLYSLIYLLPEFGGMFPCTPTHDNQRVKVCSPAPQEIQEMFPFTPPHGNLLAPRRQEDEIQEISRILPSVSSPLRGKRVLLVDDDIVQQMIAKKLLLKHGVTIDTCGNGKEGFDLVFKGLNDQRDLGASHILPYEYIFMDYQMPVMNGCEATRQIRLKEKDFGVHIPIIGLTAHEAGEELNEFFIAGIDIHVPKPLNAQKVLKVIEELHS